MQPLAKKPTLRCVTGCFYSHELFDTYVQGRTLVNTLDVLEILAQDGSILDSLFLHGHTVVDRNDALNLIRLPGQFSLKRKPKVLFILSEILNVIV